MCEVVPVCLPACSSVYLSISLSYYVWVCLSHDLPHSPPMVFHADTPFLCTGPFTQVISPVGWPRFPSSSAVQIGLALQVLMEAALALSRGVPRAYLLPSPHQRQPDAQLTFKPQITHKSKVAPLPAFCLWAICQSRVALLHMCRERHHVCCPL